MVAHVVSLRRRSVGTGRLLATPMLSIVQFPFGLIEWLEGFGTSKEAGVPLSGGNIGRQSRVSILGVT